MATHKLLLLPGDGIGPEVMGEVEKISAGSRQARRRRLRDRDGSRRRLAYDAHGAAISEAAMAKALAADAVLFGAVGGPKWDDVPYARAPRSRPAAPAQGSRPVRQPAPGDLLSGARRRLLAEARGGRGPRHHDRARADRRRLFRRAARRSSTSATARSAPSTRRSTTRYEIERIAARRLRAGAQAPQQGHLDRRSATS